MIDMIVPPSPVSVTIQGRPSHTLNRSLVSALTSSITHAASPENGYCSIETVKEILNRVAKIRDDITNLKTSALNKLYEQASFTPDGSMELPQNMKIYVRAGFPANALTFG